MSRRKELIVVSAVNGIEVNTRRMFAEAEKHNLTRLLVINKCDAENVHFPELIATIQETFGKKCVLLNAPVGQGTQFTGVINVLNPPEPAPADCLVDVGQARSQLGERTLLIDADLRNPRQHELFYLENKIGFSTVLAGRSREEAIVRIPDLAGLCVLPAGPVPPPTDPSSMGPACADSRARTPTSSVTWPPLMSLR